MDNISVAFLLIDIIIDNIDIFENGNKDDSVPIANFNWLLFRCFFQIR